MKNLVRITYKTNFRPGDRQTTAQATVKNFWLVRFSKFEGKNAKNREKIPKIALKGEKHLVSKNVMDFHKILYFMKTKLV